jgi:hypothetical protein
METREQLIEEITNYLCTGGLFNPELANHEVVRDLLITTRDYLNEHPERE